MKKIFLALKVPYELADEAYNWRDKHGNLPVKWISNKNLHITIVPPWEEENVEDVIEKLSIIEGKIGLIRVVFDTVAFGPNRFSPRLVWATGEVPQKIYNLKKLLFETFSKMNNRNGSFTHLTLGRFNPSDIAKFPTQRLHEEVFWSSTIDTLVLMETKILEDGPDYEVLKEVKL